MKYVFYYLAFWGLTLLLLSAFTHYANAFDFKGASRCVDNCYTEHTDTLDDNQETACFDRCGLSVSEYVDSIKNVSGIETYSVKEDKILVDDSDASGYCETEDFTLPPGEGC